MNQSEMNREFNRVDSLNGSLAGLLDQLSKAQTRKADIVQNTNNMLLRTTTAGYLPHHTAAYKGPSENVSEIIIEADKGMPTLVTALNPVAMNQLATKAGIATRDFRRFQDEYPAELDNLVNAIFQKEPNNRMIRAYTSDTENYFLGRAFVSDAFKTFDNYDLLEAALPPLLENESADWRAVHATVTDQKMYIRLKSELFTGTGAAVGDEMAAGIVISNSEVGLGSISVAEMVWTLACLNGMQTSNIQRSSHIQSARGEQSFGLLADDTKLKDNELTALKMRDYVAAYSSRENFDQTLSKFKNAGGDLVQSDAQTAVSNLGTVLQLTKAQTSNVLDGLLQTVGQSGYAGNPISRATLVNAVTAVANNSEPDLVDDWHKLGGRVLDLPSRDWNRVAAAA